MAVELYFLVVLSINVSRHNPQRIIICPISPSKFEKQYCIHKSPERACFSTNRRVFAATTPCRNNLQIDVEQRHESWFALKRMCPWPPSLGSESKSDGGSAALKSVICLSSLAYLLFYPGAAAAVSAPDDVNTSIVCATILNIINGIQDD